MTTLTDAELIDRVARVWCEMDGISPNKKGLLPPSLVEGYRADAKELLARAGIITPAGRAELERREGEG